MSLILDVEDRRIGTSTAIPFGDTEIPASFPVERWNAQLMRYEDYWRWYTGQVWEELDDAKNSKGKPVLKFPLQINLIRSAVIKHTAVLFGEVPDGPEPLVRCQIDPKISPGQKGPDKDSKRRAAELEQFINDVWFENDGRTMQQEGGLVSQFLGGIYYRIGWEPLNPSLTSGIKLEMVLPDFVMPVWNSSDLNDLLEIWVVWRVPTREAALRFGYDYTIGPGTPLYVEHWTADEVTITLNGIPLSMDVDDETYVFDHMENPFGFVPFEYIVNSRSGGFFGDSLVDPLKGTSREYNARLADLGEVISDGSHRDVFLRNVGTSRTRNIGKLQDVIELQPANPNGPDPMAFSIEAAKMSEGLLSFPDVLHKQFLRDAFISSVAEGEDEGSQRSALTLAFRMWTTTSYDRMARTYWGAGLTRLNQKIARLAVDKGVGGISLAHLKNINWRTRFSVMIPRDREQETNETVLMLQAQSMSPQTALERLDVVADPYEELERIKEWLEWQAELASKNAMAQEKNKATVKQQITEPVAATGFDNK